MCVRVLVARAVAADNIAPASTLPTELTLKAISTATVASATVATATISTATVATTAATTTSSAPFNPTHSGRMLALQKIIETHAARQAGAGAAVGAVGAVGAAASGGDVGSMVEVAVFCQLPASTVAIQQALRHLQWEVMAPAKNIGLAQATKRQQPKSKARAYLESLRVPFLSFLSLSPFSFSFLFSPFSFLLSLFSFLFSLFSFLFRLLSLALSFTPFASQPKE
jgi:hypothetical protein